MPFRVSLMEEKTMQEAYAKRTRPQVAVLNQEGRTEAKGHRGLQFLPSRRVEVHDVRKFSGKLYEDETFGPLHTPQFEDVTLTGSWDMELIDECDSTYVLRLVNHVSGDSITFAFPSPLERKGFAESVVCLGRIRQVSCGMDLEGLVQKQDAVVKKPWEAMCAATSGAAADLVTLASKIINRKNSGPASEAALSRVRN